MEVIFFIEYTTHWMDHLLPPYQHTFTTTAQPAHRPTLEEWVHMLPQSHLSFHRLAVMQQNFHWPHATAVATSWPGNYRRKATLPTLGPPVLYVIVAVSLTCVAIQGQSFISKTAPKDHTVVLLFGKEHM